MKNTIEIAVSLHKMVVMSSVLINTLDELSKVGNNHKGFKKSTKEVMGYCTSLLNTAYGVKGIQQSTYLIEIEKEIDKLFNEKYKVIK